MKKMIVLLLTLVFAQHIQAQNSVQPIYKVVMAINKGDSINQRWMVRQLYNLRIAMPDAEVEVVCYGSGLETLMAAKCKVPNDLQELMKKGVVFAACENSMSGLKVTRDALVPQCTTVRAGIAQLVIRQAQDWQYVYGSR